MFESAGRRDGGANPITCQEDLVPAGVLECKRCGAHFDIGRTGGGRLEPKRTVALRCPVCGDTSDYSVDDEVVRPPVNRSSALDS